MAVQTLLVECLSIREGRLLIEECDADELARRFGTPFTVRAESIKRPETVADILRRDVVPPRLTARQ